MYCSNCGKEIPTDANVCPGCGTAQNGNGAAKSPAVSAGTPMTVGEWLITILLTWIPIVGFVMMFVWGFGHGENLTKKNWARANLIWTVIGLVISFVFGASFIAALLHAFS